MFRKFVTSRLEISKFGMICKREMTYFGMNYSNTY